MSSTECSSPEKISTVDVVPVEPIPVETVPDEPIANDSALLLSALRETTLDDIFLSNDTSANVSLFFAPSLTKKADILRVASHIVEHVDDFITLTRLSMTCKLFKDLIDKHKTFSDFFFDRLEEGAFTPKEHHSCQEQPLCYTNSLRQEYDPSGLLASQFTSPIALYAPTFEQRDFMPCYGCRKVKDRYEFPTVYRTFHTELHNCYGYTRRCKTCDEENKRLGIEICTHRHIGRTKESDPVVRLWDVSSMRKGSIFCRACYKEAKRFCRE